MALSPFGSIIARIVGTYKNPYERRDTQVVTQERERESNSQYCYEIDGGLCAIVAMCCIDVAQLGVSRIELYQRDARLVARRRRASRRRESLRVGCHGRRRRCCRCRRCRFCRFLLLLLLLLCSLTALRFRWWCWFRCVGRRCCCRRRGTSRSRCRLDNARRWSRRWLYRTLPRLI